MPKKLGAIVVSDLHLNHPKLSTDRMVNSLIKNISTSYNSTITHLIIPGDVFDRPVQLDTVAGKGITRFISFVLEFSCKHDLVLLVLKGTGSHDGEQSDHFVSMNEGRLVKADLTYVDKISVFTDRLGISWLGVPDEATPSAAQTQAEIESLMKEKGISKVHMGLTHGLYNTHNLNGIVDDHAHDTEFYESVVEYIILNGHIHHPSQHGRLVTIGSHDRNRHGEEEAKGGLRVHIDFKKNTTQLEFRENKEAALFVTYEIKSEVIKTAYREVDKFLISHPIVAGGFLRLAYKDTLNINDLVRLLQDKYHPDIEFSTKKLETVDNSNHLNERVVEFDKIDTTPITKSTVTNLLDDKLKRLGYEDTSLYLEEFNKLIQ
ncbi:hypothetical protein TSMG140 [Halocynthia phage JM-2012]|uniref:SbcD-like subunit of palindrome specific endonuclease n=1 Tax=Halocynthia phage JM-2012 TaxID=1173297 RepID=UPI00025C6968|nr:SbcD-like subunit of palindrome specific endonuclease [Halocynthia phage JM-2012]AFI55423.1 hypothetical protein TSMG140 [Halocynthia phage JM-2012]